MIGVKVDEKKKAAPAQEEAKKNLVADYYLLLSDSAEDAVDSLAAHLAARSALAQLLL